ncbi:MAG: hypothetical protein ABI091_08060 [Ferruginibacter sp.]
MQDDKKPTPVNPSDITESERADLDNSFNIGDSKEEEQLQRSELDSTDDDGTPLNEKTSENDLVGDDLDIPGASLDDADEAIGEEDEENNGYSQADTQ